MDFHGRDGMSSPLKEDLEDCLHTSSDPSIAPSDREAAAKNATAIEWYLTRGGELLRKRAKDLGVDEWCRTLPDEKLTELVSDIVGNQVSVVYSATLMTMVEHEAAAFGKVDGGFWDAVSSLSAITSHALADELCERQSQNENKGGRALREALVEQSESERGRLLNELARKAASKLWFPDPCEDAESVALEAIWNELSSFAKYSPPAAHRETLLEFVSGGLNKILRHAHDRVRTEIETELRRTEFLRSAYELETDSRAFGPVNRPVLFEFLPLPTGQRSLEGGILFEELLRHSELTEVQQKVIFEYYFEGKTQKEVAAALGISQPTVSNCLEKAEEKMRQVLVKQLHTAKKVHTPPAV